MQRRPYRSIFTQGGHYSTPKLKKQRRPYKSILYTPTILHIAAFIRSLYKEQLSHTNTFPHRSIFTQKPLHTVAFTQRCFQTEEPLHTSVCT